ALRACAPWISLSGTATSRASSRWSSGIRIGLRSGRSCSLPPRAFTRASLCIAARRPSSTLAMCSLWAPCLRVQSCAAWRRSLETVASWPGHQGTMPPLSPTTLRPRRPV
ncbi:ribosomal protein L8, partial [Homo sapiens]